MWVLLVLPLICQANINPLKTYIPAHPLPKPNTNCEHCKSQAPQLQISCICNNQQFRYAGGINILGAYKIHFRFYTYNVRAPLQHLIKADNRQTAYHSIFLLSASSNYVSVACINNLKKGAIPCPQHLHSFVFYKNAISLGPVSPILYFTGQVWTRDVLGCWVALSELWGRSRVLVWYWGLVWWR